MSNSIVPVSTLVANAKNQIELVYPFLARKKTACSSVFFVDIRDIRELWKEGKIENSFHAPRGMLEFWADPSSPYYKKFFTLNKSYILYCASGWRSALGAYTLKQMGFTNVLSLEGGLNKWKKCELPTVSVEKTSLTKSS